MNRAVTNTEQAVIDFIAEAAARGEKCPSNTVIADHIGYGLTNISSLLKTIEAKGAITVERGNNKRVVTIVATGARTAGDVMPGRLAARIGELREAGHDIRTELMEVRDRHGNTSRPARYVYLGRAT